VPKGDFREEKKEKHLKHKERPLSKVGFSSHLFWHNGGKGSPFTEWEDINHRPAHAGRKGGLECGKKGHDVEKVRLVFG